MLDFLKKLGQGLDAVKKLLIFIGSAILAVVTFGALSSKSRSRRALSKAEDRTNLEVDRIKRERDAKHKQIDRRYDSERDAFQRRMRDK